MRKRLYWLIPVILCLALSILAGCGETEPTRQQSDAPQPSGEDASGESAISPLVQAYYDENADHIGAVVELAGGDLFIALRDDEAGEEIDYSFQILTENALHRLEVIDLYSGSELPCVKMFYVLPSQNVMAPSCFQLWPQKDPTDVLVFVDGLEWSLAEFPVDPDAVPTDSLGTQPVKLQSPNWQDNVPRWIFALPYEKIDAEYALEYRGYTLRGEDILSRSWQCIGRNDPNGYRDSYGGVTYLPPETTQTPTTEPLDTTSPSEEPDPEPAVAEAIGALSQLYEEEQPLLEAVAKQFLLLQREAIRENPSLLPSRPYKLPVWKSPLYSYGELTWDQEADEDRAALLTDLQQALDQLSAEAPLTQVYPWLSCDEVADCDICRFDILLRDAEGKRLHTISLSYCAQLNTELPDDLPFDWLDPHWFLWVD